MLRLLRRARAYTCHSRRAAPSRADATSATPTSTEEAPRQQQTSNSESGAGAQPFTLPADVLALLFHAERRSGYHEGACVKMSAKTRRDKGKSFA